MSSKIVWKNRPELKETLTWTIDASLIPTLGLNETVVYCLLKTGVERSSARLEHAAMGKHWFYCPRTLMQELMPWWSAATIDRAVSSLRQQGVIVTGTKVLPATHPHSWYSLPDSVQQKARRHRLVPAEAELKEYMMSIGRTQAEYEAVVLKYSRWTDSGQPWKDGRGNAIKDWRRVV